MKVPQKRLLATETRAVILEAIQTGVWTTYMPGERTLCERFKISRPTLRQALRQLENEGVIANHQGQRRSILKRAVERSPQEEKTTIGFLCPTNTKEMFGYTSRKIAAIEHYIHQKDLNFELHVRPGCYTRSPSKALKTLIDETRIEVWILQQTNREMQFWFQKNRIPAVVTGSRFDGIELPSVDVDNAAVCRHAVGLLLAKKRKSICYLKSIKTLPGDLQSETGFMQGVKSYKGVRGKIARCHNTPEGIERKLDAVMESVDQPDSFLVDHTSHAFCAATYLMKRGFRIPEDFPILCRTESFEFAFMRPSIAHYSRNTQELAIRTAEIAIKLAKGEIAESKSVLIIPDFVHGDSI